MALWSKLINGVLSKDKIIKPLVLKNVKFSGTTPLCGGHGGPRTFKITPSRFSWHQFKDDVHFFVMLGLIPCGLIVFYSNVFIGPAQLQPIPEGYTPKHWEYFQHPITRFIARYVWVSPQQNYEKQMHYLFEEEEKRRILILEDKIMKMMRENRDYQSYYYRPQTAKYIRKYKENTDEYLDREGFKKLD